MTYIPATHKQHIRKGFLAVLDGVNAEVIASDCCEEATNNPQGDTPRPNPLSRPYCASEDPGNPYDNTKKLERDAARRKKWEENARLRKIQHATRNIPRVASPSDAAVIAEATGVRLSLGQYEQRTYATPPTVARGLGDYGVMRFELAQQEAELFLEQLADMPDIDENGTNPVTMPDGTTMAPFRAAMLQRMARRRRDYHLAEGDPDPE